MKNRLFVSLQSISPQDTYELQRVSSNFTVEKLGGYHQVIKVNFSSNETDGCDALQAFLSKMHRLNVIMRKHQANSDNIWGQLLELSSTTLWTRCAQSCSIIPCLHNFESGWHCAGTTVFIIVANYSLYMSLPRIRTF